MSPAIFANGIIIAATIRGRTKYNDFLLNEGRYAQLVKVNPEEAQCLFETNLKDAQKRYANYKRLAEIEFPNK